jgi:hypothetical protein
MSWSGSIHIKSLNEMNEALETNGISLVGETLNHHVTNFKLIYIPKQSYDRDEEVPLASLAMFAY